ncbi:AhpA/YtjB family protein [Thalassotalea sp. PLHSN55]|uniref:AhpA/YtjB family protein n=1 Tax=Thalassotalea sp. PLHSN55 TaxID=3435888 RepID=UPI003F85A651
MTQSEQPLYPKLSSIYNKIMQLAIAIALIIVLLSILVFNQQSNSDNIEQHFNHVAHEYSGQAALAISALLVKKDNQALQDYIDELALSSEVIHNVHIYGVSGQLLFSSDAAQSIRALYGIEQHKINNGELYIPFVEELRADNLQGYLRLTLVKEQLVTRLNHANNESSEMFRIMLALAGIVGFLLTRGLNRFSRQGYRLAKETTNKAT